jgi:hypothetical protein
MPALPDSSPSTRSSPPPYPEGFTHYTHLDRPKDIPDKKFPTLELMKRLAMPRPEPAPQPKTADQLATYLATLGLEEREERFGVKMDKYAVKGRSPIAANSISSRTTHGSVPYIPFSPMEVHDLGKRQNMIRDTQPLSGIAAPKAYAKGWIVLYSLLLSALALTAIWFFFWAKNGGFHFKQGDWDDYKSTVLRRKDKNGKTLSGATTETDLDQSEVSEMTMHDEEAEYGMRSHRRNDVREYRHEKAAKVGGLNREADGSYYDAHGSNRSEITEDPSVKPLKIQKKRGFFHRKADKKTTQTPMAQQQRDVSNSYSFTTGDDSTTVSGNSGTALMDDEHRGQPAYHSSRHHGRRSHRAERSSHRESRRGNYRDVEHEATIAETASYMEGDDGTVFTEDNEGDLGTKSYVHHIPGLSTGTPTEGGRSSAGGAKKGKGYRRGGGRRDSLSDSE